jgi:hypothetical protein
MPGQVLEGRHEPQNDATILSPPTGVFPCSGCQGSVNDATSLAICAGLHSGEPGIDDQASAGIEFVGLIGEINVVNGIQKGRGRELL